MTAFSYPPAADAPVARLVLSCSHCGAEMNVHELTDALLSALHAAPIPDGGTPPPRPSGDRAAALRPRQQEILQLLGDGWRVPSIARRLGITIPTVRKHLHAIYSTLGVHSQAELVDWIRAPHANEEPRLRSVLGVRALDSEANVE